MSEGRIPDRLAARAVSMTSGQSPLENLGDSLKVKTSNYLKDLAAC
jgi:hypothetical protein